jgi:metallo-beta-lactamase class B
MPKDLFRNIMLIASLSLACSSVQAQKVQEPAATNAEWSKPYQPFRIAGNLYYVGTYDLACYLITTSQGNILINTGLAASAEQIKKNIENLGFRFSDTKILLTTQAHFDHVGAMAAIKKMTGARFMVNDREAAVMADGGMSDYAMGGQTSTFEPVIADRLLHDGDTVQLGETTLAMLHHPGHTKGSSSFILKTKDEKRSYTVLIANLPSIITEKSFSDIPAYPGIGKDYAYTLQAMKGISFDIWVASHASQFRLHTKHKPGSRYNPLVFIDRSGYNKSLNDLQKQYDEHPGRQ